MVKIKKEELKVLILENISQKAVNNFIDHDMANIEHLSGSLSESELIEKIKDVHIIGIRSRTKLNEQVLQHAHSLLAVGCFCIGTNQVDLEAAKKCGVPVFNSPYANTRSVAEMVIAETIFLMRGLFKKSVLAHQGGWLKSAENSFEIRGKTLGIVGYGNIGSQVGILAEMMGMKVMYYDVLNKLPLGNASRASSLKELLNQADVVTLHVPGLTTTQNLITSTELFQMKEGSYIINASRGDVIDINALKENLDNGKILGAAIDVFPVEPKSKEEKFVSPLQNNYNVIMTPHIGGSTLEAQKNIGMEVSNNLIKYITLGETLGSVNFPQMPLPERDLTKTRIQHIHQNIPGVLASINNIFAEDDVNIGYQHLKTDADIGHVIFNVEKIGDHTLEKLSKVPGTIRTRIFQ